MKVDPRFGHIVVTGNPKADGAFVDLGPVLHWWAYTSLHLDPEAARELASALTKWAERAERPRTPWLVPIGKAGAE